MHLSKFPFCDEGVGTILGSIIQYSVPPALKKACLLQLRVGEMKLLLEEPN